MFSLCVQDLLLEEFQSLDIENSGLVNREDVFELMEKLNAPVEREHMAKLIPLYDKSKDGRFDYRVRAVGFTFWQCTYL